MDFKACLLLFILTVSWCCNAREFMITDRVTKNNELVSVSAENNQQSERALQAVDGVTRNAKLCTLCEEFTSEALSYLSNNNTQTEIIELLHNSCARVPTFKRECIILVDYYAPLFFLEVSTVQPKDFCNKVDLCDKVVSIYQGLSGESCDLCHRTVAEALLKLQDPDTQLEIVEMLLKACGAVKNYTKKCKRLVFEYAPVILVNAEQFLEANDICTIMHACKSPATDKMMHSSS